MAGSYVVLGAGRQGLAIAYDLARHAQPATIVLADSDPHALDFGLRRLGELLPDQAERFVARACDVRAPGDIADTLRGMDVAISAVPYRFNLALTEAALDAGVSFCDLGGNTGVVRAQLALHERALAAGISIVPDCGLAPGLGNILAAHGVASMDTPRHVHVRCGGLPERPVGPLGYKLLFNFQGLINEYSGNGEFLRGGRRVQIPTLSELEEIEFPPPVGVCEAAVTSGGTSTCPDTFFGKLHTYDYKTVRYPGHFAIIRALFELGCFDDEVTLPDGRQLAPRSVLQPLMEARLAFPEVRDIVVLRVTVTGEDLQQPASRQYDLFDRHDAETGFTAMERTTGFPTAIIAQFQAERRIEPGARPLETCVPLDDYLDALGHHGLFVKATRC